jgi:hypothetical protein
MWRQTRRGRGQFHPCDPQGWPGQEAATAYAEKPLACFRSTPNHGLRRAPAVGPTSSGPSPIDVPARAFLGTVCSCVRLEATIRRPAPQELSGAVQQRRAYGTRVHGPGAAWRWWTLHGDRDLQTEEINKNDVSRSLPLALPPPDIVEAILDDRILMLERPLLTTGEAVPGSIPASLPSILILRSGETPELIRRAQAFAR